MIVLTTPTGDIGKQVLERVLGGSEPVRVVVRDPAKLATSAQGRVEVIEGAHGDPEVVDRAFRGADTVFWLVPPDPKAESVEAAYVGFSQPARDAIVQHGVRRVVTVSALGRGTPFAQTAGYVTGSLAMDDLLAGTGVAFRALTMPSFMDNILRQAQLIRDQGIFTSPISGDRKLPTCATRDIADAAAKLLLDASWNGQGSVAVLGPEDLSFNDMAQIMSEVLGKLVRFQQTTLEAYKDQFVSFGMSDAMAQGMTDMAAAKDKGLDNGVVRTPENTTPTSFRQWCEQILSPQVLG